MKIDDIVVLPDGRRVYAEIEWRASGPGNLIDVVSFFAEWDNEDEEELTSEELNEIADDDPDAVWTVGDYLMEALLALAQETDSNRDL